MTFRFEIDLELEHPHRELSETQRVPIAVIYQAGRWRAQCQQPPVLTTLAESVEQALVLVAKEIVQDWQSAPGAAAV